MGRPLEIPFSYGDVLAITGTGAKVVMWFKDDNKVIRGVLVDVTDPNSPQMAKDEVVIRRKTEGNVRKKGQPPPKPPGTIPTVEFR
jgi:hypothetical protein